VIVFSSDRGPQDFIQQYELTKESKAVTIGVALNVFMQ
jgi:hypothetical protein